MSEQSLVLRSVYLKPELDDKLRDLAYQRRTSKNDLIRKYIELGMQKANEQEKQLLSPKSAKKVAASSMTKSRKQAVA